MLRAVPLTEFMAASTVKQLRSGILILAISSTCFSVILPTLFLFGSAEPNKNRVGKITLKQVEEIAKIKMPDLNCFELESAMRSVEGTARSMGVDVV